ncbi:MAG: hypothetical protein Q8T11_11110 [Elusimicrobiota bacterium]|nr:hypothetical protein [Elusimicrobiota bacterium]
MKPALALAVLVALAACKRAPEEGPIVVPTQEVVAGVGMIDFTSDEAKFTARVPGEWGVRESRYLDPAKGLSMWDGKRTHISITKFPEMEPRYKDARAYAETFWMLSDKGQPDITEEKIGGRTVLRFHYERPYYKPHSKKLEYMNRFDYALFPIEGGFFQIEHRAPASEYKATLPVFEAVVRSFKPKM